MKFFNKEETIVVSVILLVLIVVSSFNFRISLRRARDAQRKGDIREYSRFLDKFQNEYGFMPASSNGKIKACNPKMDEKGSYSFEVCEWDPSDPHHNKGARYYYLSNSKRYQIFASLEGKDEAEYNPRIEARNLPCGNRICNFGLSSSKTPLEKSIEEIENRLKEELKIEN
jgi:type II secretory pathway pseudopilin PulG